MSGEALDVLSLFSGIGGIELGLEMAGGFNTVAFCDPDEACQQQLAKQWVGVPIYGDIRELSRGRLLADGVRLPRVIAGGFPCQDISYAGRGAGLAGERSGLWWEMHRLVGELEPDFVVGENVSALRSRGLDVVLGSLAALGSDAEWHCLTSAAVGAPHRRDRTWIVAHAQRLGLSGQGQLVKSIHSAPGAYREADRFVDAFRERALPFVCGGHDGLPPRVDRQAVKQLGNAVDPQVARIIGLAIKQAVAKLEGREGYANG
jgi:DNA (cytosine-5)-methyltransferase 1